MKVDVQKYKLPDFQRHFKVNASRYYLTFVFFFLFTTPTVLVDFIMFKNVCEVLIYELCSPFLHE